MRNIHAAPFVKWAGGKRQLLPKIQEKMPQNFNKYIEPFVGGGAVYFALQPETAIINDINKALINAYRRIKEQPAEFMREIRKYDQGIQAGKKEAYYEIRDDFNRKLIQEEYDIELAALFVFLNKHCFNGLYRVNRKGMFNVPYNNSVGESCSEAQIMAISESLQGITILNGDFQNACDLAVQGDFVFFDSPYAPLNPDSFSSYTKEGFERESHIRLSETYKELTERGCYCMLTNHNTDLINELYKGFHKEVIDVKRMINSDAKNRVGQEIIITNY